jgi:hypothetical protein
MTMRAIQVIELQTVKARQIVTTVALDRRPRDYDSLTRDAYGTAMVGL